MREHQGRRCTVAEPALPHPPYLGQGTLELARCNDFMYDTVLLRSVRRTEANDHFAVLCKRLGSECNVYADNKDGCCGKTVCKGV